MKNYGMMIKVLLNDERTPYERIIKRVVDNNNIDLIRIILDQERFVPPKNISDIVSRAFII